MTIIYKIKIHSGLLHGGKKPTKGVRCFLRKGTSGDPVPSSKKKSLSKVTQVNNLVG